MTIPWTRTKIIATLGPATADPATLGALLRSGADVVRFNFAHGSHAGHGRLLRRTRLWARRLGRPVGVLLDLPGPKLRVGALPPDGLPLVLRQEVRLTAGPVARADGDIPIPHPGLLESLRPGQDVFIADGLIRLRVLEVRGRTALCRVAAGGRVRAGNGVNLPQTALPLRAFTREDERHLAFGLARGVDFVGLSFVESADDVRRVREFARRRGRAPFLIAKIERRRALKNLKAIIAAADGLMVARGDLGVEVPFSGLPALQDEITARARAAGKPVIVATQVLESMVENPRPTRAEAMDAAHAVKGGADAIMLSGETSVGKHPVEAVRALGRIIAAAERDPAPSRPPDSAAALSPSDALVREACRLAEDIRARALVVPTRTGRTAARLSQRRPRAPIWVLGEDEGLARRLSLHWGVEPLAARPPRRLDRLVPFLRRTLPRLRRVRPGQRVVLISGGPGVAPGETGMIQIVAF